jgi:hypothetical protein
MVLFSLWALLLLFSFSLEGKEMKRHRDHSFQVADAMQRWREKENESRASKRQVPSHCVDMALITFVFLGDGSQLNISQTVNSLIHLKSCRWRAIILYSVVDPTELVSKLEAQPPFHLSNIPRDPRLSYFPTMHLLRSIDEYLAPNISTAWVSFLPTGCELNSRYLSSLKSEINSFPDASSVIFQSHVGPTLTSVTASQSVLFPGYGYALKQSLFSYLQPQPPQSLSEYISTLMICAGSSVLSPAVPFRSSLPRPQVPGSLVSFKSSPSTPCLTKDKVTSVPTSQSEEKVVSIDLPDEAAFLSRFVFPEAESIFFRDNVQGLKEALVRAHKFGCIDPRLKVS